MKLCKLVVINQSRIGDHNDQEAHAMLIRQRRYSRCYLSTYEVIFPVCNQTGM